MSSSGAVDPQLATLLARCAARRSWAEQDEGPYHLEAQTERRDLVEDRHGVALQLGLRLMNGEEGPLPDATVEIWHCDALGRYSGFPPPPSSAVTAAEAPAEHLPGQTFLRGHQTADAQGMVEFRTIYPGWYPGRTVHIHLMVHTGDRVHTSQLYLPEDVNADVLASPPYSERPGRDTTNGTDTIFPTGGEPALLDVEPVGAGYRAGICLVVANRMVSTA